MYVFKRGDEINTNNGWRFVVSHVELWSEDDGCVYGSELRNGKRTAVRYLGTVRGLRGSDPFYYLAEA